MVVVPRAAKKQHNNIDGNIGNDGDNDDCNIGVDDNDVDVDDNDDNFRGNAGAVGSAQRYYVVVCSLYAHIDGRRDEDDDDDHDDKNVDDDEAEDVNDDVDDNVVAALHASRVAHEQFLHLYNTNRTAVRNSLRDDEQLVEIAPDGNCLYSSLKRSLHCILMKLIA